MDAFVVKIEKISQGHALYYHFCGSCIDFFHFTWSFYHAFAGQFRSYLGSARFLERNFCGFLQNFSPTLVGMRE